MCWNFTFLGITVSLSDAYIWLYLSPNVIGGTIFTALGPTLLKVLRNLEVGIGHGFPFKCIAEGREEVEEFSYMKQFSLEVWAVVLESCQQSSRMNIPSSFYPSSCRKRDLSTWSGKSGRGIDSHSLVLEPSASSAPTLASFSASVSISSASISASSTSAWELVKMPIWGPF